MLTADRKTACMVNLDTTEHMLLASLSLAAACTRVPVEVSVSELWQQRQSHCLSAQYGQACVLHTGKQRLRESNGFEQALQQLLHKC